AAAWNPSITGTKSEDTILADADGHQFLTRGGNWPTLTVEHDGQRLEFVDVLRGTAARHGDRRCLTYRHDDQRDEYSYAQVLEQSLRVAALLRARGVE